MPELKSAKSSSALRVEATIQREAAEEQAEAPSAVEAKAGVEHVAAQSASKPEPAELAAAEDAAEETAEDRVEAEEGIPPTDSGTSVPVVAKAAVGKGKVVVEEGDDDEEESDDDDGEDGEDGGEGALPPVGSAAAGAPRRAAAFTTFPRSGLTARERVSMGGACRVSKSFDQRNSMAGPRASSANELVSAAEKNDLKRTITFAASSPRARVQAQERGSIAGRHSTAGRLSFSSKSFSFSARRPKGELKEAEEMTRSLTMAARKARGPQSGWAKARKGLGFAGKLNLAEITVNAIEVEVKNLCERWGVPYVAGPALEQPEVLLERHRTLRKQCLDAKQRHCHVLVKSGRARVARTAGLGALDGQIVRTLHVEKRGRDVWGVLVRDGKGEQTAVEAHLLKAIEVAVADTTDANAPGLLPRLMPGASSSELLAADPLSAGRATSPDYCRDSSGRASRSGLFAMGASSGRVAPLSSKGSAPLLQSSKSKLWFSSKAKNYPPAPNFDNCAARRLHRALPAAPRAACAARCLHRSLPAAPLAACAPRHTLATDP